MSLSFLLTLAGCDTALGDSAETGTADSTVVVSAETFGCITEMSPVRNYYATNLLGNLDETLAVAENPDGQRFPAGTLIQLIPMEVMVKRESGFSAETDDWEFFFLSYADGVTTIETRGANATNSFGDACADCHAAAAETRDWVCEQGNGCVDLGISAETIRAIQQSDARCSG